MKVLILIGFLLLGNINKGENPEFDPYFFRNNFNEDIFDGGTGTSLYSLFRIGDSFGDSSDIPCTNLDTNLYKNKNLGFVLNDLSNKYKYDTGLVINGLLAMDINNFSYRTHFAFSFKYNDTLCLGIVGIIAKSDRFSEESDSVAFKKLLEIDKYALLPVFSNMKVEYRDIIKLLKGESNFKPKDEQRTKLKQLLEDILKEYPEVAR